MVGILNGLGRRARSSDLDCANPARYANRAWLGGLLGHPFRGLLRAISRPIVAGCRPKSRAI